MELDFYYIDCREEVFTEEFINKAQEIILNFAKKKHLMLELDDQYPDDFPVAFQCCTNYENEYLIKQLEDKLKEELGPDCNLGVDNHML